MTKDVIWFSSFAGKEDQERIVFEERRKAAESERRHKTAFVGSVLGSVLIRNLSLANHGAETELSKRWPR